MRYVRPYQMPALHTKQNRNGCTVGNCISPLTPASMAFPVVLFLMTLLLLMSTGCGKPPAVETKTELIPVKTAPVQQQTLAIPVFSGGRLFPKAMVKLSFKVGGIIEKIYVEEGDTVSAGQLLATLDRSEIKAHYSQAENGFKKAQRDLGRVKNLYADKAATLEQYQDMQTAFAVAESNLKIAKFNFTHSRISAPTKGKILKRLAEEGEMTGTGMPILLFGSTENHWVVKAGVSERDIVRLEIGDSASIHFDAYPGRSFTGTVSEISQALDTSSGTYEVEIEVNDQDAKLAAGFVAKLQIEPSLKENLFVIPIDALVEGDGSEGTVFTVENEKAKKIDIRIAHLFKDTAAVTKGLENVKNVVTAGAAYLSEGVGVTIQGEK